MATHSSNLAWKIHQTEKPGGLQSMGSQRVGHNWAIEHTHTCTAYIISLVPFIKDGNQNLDTRNAYCCQYIIVSRPYQQRKGTLSYSPNATHVHLFYFCIHASVYISRQIYSKNCEFIPLPVLSVQYYKVPLL